jgi:hypothetical protein
VREREVGEGDGVAAAAGVVELGGELAGDPPAPEQAHEEDEDGQGEEGEGGAVMAEEAGGDGGAGGHGGLS